MKELRLILASQSPRRRQLLAEAGYEFTVLPPEDDAEPMHLAGESPEDFVCRSARRKAENIAGKLEAGCVIGCDTVAVCGGKILGKPADRNEASEMLRQLRGQNHRVLSGLCLLRKTSPDDPGSCRVTLAETELFMLPIDDAALAAYLDTNAWQGKAGAFGYQDRHDWIRVVRGSESNVVGLPMELLREELGARGREDDGDTKRF